MPLNIKDDETHELAREVARLTGTSLTKAVRQALRDKLDRLERKNEQAHLADQLDEIALHCAALPLLDPRNADEILGYNDYGLPQ